MARHGREGDLLLDITIHFPGIGVEGLGNLADIIVFKMIAQLDASLIGIDARQFLVELCDRSGQSFFKNSN